MSTWVARDKKGADGIGIFISKDKPKLDIDSKTVYGLPRKCEFYMEISPYEFKKLFGFTPRKGSCHQYELQAFGDVENDR